MAIQTQTAEYYIPLHTDGILSQMDLIRECPAAKWIPLLSLIREDDPDQAPLIPLFLSRSGCNQWCRRNIPEGWVKGHYTIFPTDLLRFAVEGWASEVFHPTKRFPKGWKMVPQVFDVAHHEDIGVQGNYKGKAYELNRQPDWLDEVL